MPTLNARIPPYLKPGLKHGVLQLAHSELERTGVCISDLEDKCCLRTAYLEASKLSRLIPINLE